MQNIRCIMRSYSITWPEDVDWIFTGCTQPMPIIVTMSIDLDEALSPREINKPSNWKMKLAGSKDAANKKLETCDGTAPSIVQTLSGGAGSVSSMAASAASAATSNVPGVATNAVSMAIGNKSMNNFASDAVASISANDGMLTPGALKGMGIAVPDKMSGFLSSAQSLGEGDIGDKIGAGASKLTGGISGIGTDLAGSVGDKAESGDITGALSGLTGMASGLMNKAVGVMGNNKAALSKVGISTTAGLPTGGAPSEERIAEAIQGLKKTGVMDKVGAVIGDLEKNDGMPDLKGLAGALSGIAGKAQALKPTQPNPATDGGFKKEEAPSSKEFDPATDGYYDSRLHG